MPSIHPRPEPAPRRRHTRLCSVPDTQPALRRAHTAPRRPAKRPPCGRLRAFSFGGGWQSTAALVLAGRGELDFDTFLFANVGDDSENPTTLTYLRRHAIPYAQAHNLTIRELRRVRRDGSTETLYGRLTREGSRSIPIPVRMSNGAPGTRSCSVICTIHSWLIMASHVLIKECLVDLRRQVMEGRVPIPRSGAVVETTRAHPPYAVLDASSVEIDAVTEYLEDLVLGDCSPLTCRSYAFGLLRWFRVLWLLEVSWERATEADVAVMVGWLRTAPNPQRRRTAGAPGPGAVNLVTGKPTLQCGYSKRTINHALSVVSSFYEYHGHHCRGPVVNPVPSSAQRRRALAHLSPLEPKPVVARARLRQKVPDRPPRAIPDQRWDELFAAMGCERDRALLEFAVSSGVRAAELLGVAPEDVDWAGRRIYVISKGTQLREAVPASPQAFVRLASYLDEVGRPRSGESVWRTRRGPDRPLSYWALRRVLQRANELLGANWTWHDLRHTAATRMANSPQLTLPEVQAILRHASIQTTGRYVTVRVEELFDRLNEHYSRPRPQPRYAAGYAAEDIAAVFGG